MSKRKFIHVIAQLEEYLLGYRIPDRRLDEYVNVHSDDIDRFSFHKDKDISVEYVFFTLKSKPEIHPYVTLDVAWFRSLLESDD